MLRLKDLYALLANNAKHEYDVDKQIEIRLAALGYSRDKLMNDNYHEMMVKNAREMGAPVENDSALRPDKVYYSCSNTYSVIRKIATVFHSGEFGEALGSDLVIFTTKFARGENLISQSVDDFIATPIAAKQAVVTYLRQLAAA